MLKLISLSYGRIVPSRVRGYTGPQNARALCVDCHLIENRKPPRAEEHRDPASSDQVFGKARNRFGRFTRILAGTCLSGGVKARRHVPRGHCERAGATKVAVTGLITDLRNKDYRID